MKFVPGNKMAGSRKGRPNRSTSMVKAVMEEAFTRLGGIDALVSWAKDNPTEFFKLFSKLLPVQVNADIQVDTSLAERLERAKERIQPISKGQ